MVPYPCIIPSVCFSKGPLQQLSRPHIGNLGGSLDLPLSSPPSGLYSEIENLRVLIWNWVHFKEADLWFVCLRVSTVTNEFGGLQKAVGLTRVSGY